jgi:hypothetical protein
MTFTVVIRNLGMKTFLRCDSGTEGLARQFLDVAEVGRVHDSRWGSEWGRHMTDNCPRDIQLAGV